jgi:hypothetical protein
MASVIKVDQIQSDTGTVNLSSNLQFSSGFTMSNPTLVTPTTSGILTLGAGIKFPATTVSSADANTLDDYEEGTFLPNVIGGDTAGEATYTSREGYYTKIGRMVFVFMNLRWSNHTGSGTIHINNLPFTVLSYAGFGSMTYNSGLSGTSGYFPAFWADAGSTTLRLWQATFAGGGGTIGIPMDTSVPEIHVSFFYTATS